MRRKSWIGCAVVLLGLCAPAGAMAGNEAAPWSAPTWLDGNESTGVSASGVSLSELASGGLVATWNEDLAGSNYPQLASEPFAGAWSEPDSLTTTPEQVPQDALGGVRTAVNADGKFVSVWQTPAPVDQGADENDIVGVSGSVTPGDQPAFTEHTWGIGYDPADAPNPSVAFEYPYTPQVAMSSDGTGSVEFTAVDSTASPGTDKQLVALEGGSPATLTWTPPIRDNPADGSGDYNNFIPQLAVAPLDADWTASTNDTEAMVATSNNYDTSYNGEDAPGVNALLYTTSDPLDWYTQNPTVLPMSGEHTAAGVLPNGHVLVAGDSDQVPGESTPVTARLSVWETGDTIAKVVDPDTGSPAGYPAVATFNDGSVTIAYIDDDLADDNSEVVKAVTMSPSGQWGEPVTVSPAGFQVRDVTAAYGPDGTAYVAWDATNSTTPADNGIYASVRLPDGAFPSTPQAVYANPGGGSDPKIAVDQTGFATIVAAVQDPSVGFRVAAFTRANPIPPRLVTKPAISIVGGSAKVGARLICAGDSWLNRPTTFGVKWLRGTSPIAGATQRTYTLASADTGQTVSCEVTATNVYGSGLGQSVGVKVAGSSSSTSPNTGSVGTSNGNSVTFTISCPAGAASCTVVVAQITVVEELIGNKVVAVIASKKRHKRTVVIGQTKVSLKPGQKKKVTVHLNGAGTKLLKGHAKLKVLFTVKASSKKLLSKTLTLKRPKPKPKHKHKH
jgi:hypothetical protein